ncbi:MAG: protein kinase [Planctomycetales bacterium]|nr:protein kinase [Planctomycetales bacterium]
MSDSLDKVLSLLKEQNIATDNEIHAVSQASDGSVAGWLTAAVKQGVLTNWQARQIVKGRTNLTVGRYLVLSRLPDRQNYQVLLAKHRQMDRRVTILISKSRQQDSSKFLADAGRLANLDHPNVQHTFDFDIESGTPYLVMERTTGATLQKLSDSASGKSVCVAHLAKQILDGLQYLHDRGFVHGELDGDSIIVDSGNRIRIERVEAIVDTTSQSTPREDLQAVGRSLLNLLDSRTRHEEDAQTRAFVQRLANGGFANCKDARKRLGTLHVVQESREAVIPPTRTEITREPASAPTATVRKSVAKNPLFLIGILAVGVLITIAGVVALAFVVARRQQAAATPVAQKDSDERWWEKDDEPAVESEDENATPPALAHVVDQQADAVPDLGNVGVINGGQDEAGDDTQEVTPESEMSADRPVNDPANEQPGEPTSEEETTPPVPDAEMDEADPPKPEAQESIDPFTGMAAKVALNAPSNVDAQSFGKYEGNKQPSVTLIGGKNLARKNSELQIVTGETRNSWRVRTVVNDDPETIASLTLADGDFRFHWNPDARSNVVAKYLQNCVVRLSVGNFSHDVVLRGDPVEIPRLAASCWGPVFERGVRVDGLPDPKQVFFEVIEVSEHFWQAVVAPSSATMGDVISITVKPKDAAQIKFDVSIGKKQDLVLSVSPFILMEGGGNWTALTRKKFEQAGLQATIAYNGIPALEKRHENARRQVPRKTTDEFRQNFKAAQKAEIRLIEESYKKFVETNAFCHAFGDKQAAVRIRIYTKVGDQEIDLAVSPPFEAPADGEQ